MELITSCIIPGGRGWGASIEKEQVCLLGILWRTLNRYRDHVLWAGLDFFFTPKRCWSTQYFLSYFFCSIP